MGYDHPISETIIPIVFFQLKCLFDPHYQHLSALIRAEHYSISFQIDINTPLKNATDAGAEKL